jgi:type II secretory pathway pseudopilin PulG
MPSPFAMKRSADQALPSRDGGIRSDVRVARGSAELDSPPNQQRGKAAPRGAVLLEVVLALALFAAAATIIGAGIHSAIDGVERQKLNAHAMDLAVSVLSEIQMGQRPLESVGPETFESPFDHWTWQLVLAPTETEAGETSDLTRVEVIVRHDEPALVHRLTQVLKLEKKARSTITAANFPP